jgi:hypothetical protein
LIVFGLLYHHFAPVIVASSIHRFAIVFTDPDYAAPVAGGSTAGSSPESSLLVSVWLYHSALPAIDLRRDVANTTSVSIAPTRSVSGRGHSRRRLWLGSLFYRSAQLFYQLGQPAAQLLFIALISSSILLSKTKVDYDVLFCCPFPMGLVFVASTWVQTSQ